MSRQWMTLMAILLVYIPVAIDATVLHVAAPTLSVALGSSGNELLWIIDIYSLVMAGMVLPMGALGDKIGFKRLLLFGSAIFGIASLCAALSPTAAALADAREADPAENLDRRLLAEHPAEVDEVLLRRRPLGERDAPPLGDEIVG